MDKLSGEIRNEIYHYLFGDLQRLTIEMWQTGNQPDGSWSCDNKLFQGLLRAPYLRYDVVGIIYSKLIPKLTRTTDDILHFNLRLAPFIKSLLRRIWTRASYKSAKEREALARTLSELPGLQDVIFTKCDASAKAWDVGTQFKPDVLRMLKAIQKACLQLQHAYYQKPATGMPATATVVLTSREPGKDEIIEWDIDPDYHEHDCHFSVDSEYQAWLDATRRQRKPKKRKAEDLYD